jgi:hypothetical protein
LSVLEAGHGFLNKQGRLLVDACTSYRGLGEAGSDRCLKSRYRSLCDVNDICRKRCVSSCEISHQCLNGPGVGIRSGQSLGVRLELTYRLSGKGRLQTSGRHLAGGKGEQNRYTTEGLDDEPDTHRKFLNYLFLIRKLIIYKVHEAAERIKRARALGLLAGDFQRKVRFV